MGAAYRDLASFPAALAISSGAGYISRGPRPMGVDETGPKGRIGLGRFGGAREGLSSCMGGGGGHWFVVYAAAA